MLMVPMLRTWMVVMWYVNTRDSSLGDFKKFSIDILVCVPR